MKLILRYALFASLAINAVGGEVRYRLVPLEVPRNDEYLETWGIAINDSAIVAGLAYRKPLTPFPSGVDQGVFIHSPDSGFREIGDYAGLRSQPNFINSNGVFTVFTHGVRETNGQRMSVEEAVRYTFDRGFERLGDLGGIVTTALGINSRGTIVGYGYVSAETSHAFVYTDERGMVDLGTFGGARAIAIDINDDGYISGYVFFENQGLVAYLYHEEHGLQLLGPGRGLRLNNERVVLCESDYYEPELVFPDGRRVRLLTQNITQPEFGFDLNDGNVVVGRASQGLSQVAFIWTEREGTIDLNALVPTNSGWRLYVAYGVNNRGQITGFGYDGRKGSAFRLDPIAPRPSITISGTNAVVSWSPDWAGVVLEGTDAIAGADWQPVASTGSTNVVAVPLTGASRFFRLNLDALRGLCCAPE